MNERKEFEREIVDFINGTCNAMICSHRDFLSVEAIAAPTKGVYMKMSTATGRNYFFDITSMSASEVVENICLAVASGRKTPVTLIKDDDTLRYLVALFTKEQTSSTAAAIRREVELYEERQKEI